MIDRLGALVRATIFNPAPVAVDVARRWLLDGTADRLLAWQRAQMATRFATVGPLLSGCSAVRSVRMAGLHAWLELHEPWTAAEVIDVAHRLGIEIGATSHFHADTAAGSHPMARGVRLCVGNAADTPTLVEAVTDLTRALDLGPTWAGGTRV
jgi:DNA-binding transcriptional MocR family regulator